MVVRVQVLSEELAVGIEHTNDLPDEGTLAG
jgi:hypothetical protein